MPKICYVEKRMGADKLATIETANKIITEYANQGFILTLRQLYYQFVSRALIANSDREYKKLGDVISDGRLAGLIDWEAIVDRTRNLKSLAHWGDPSEIVSACAAQFRVDRWEGQTFRPEVWIEKDALVGVIEGVCEDLDVPFFSCRGYTSQSEMWVAAMRLRNHAKRHGQTPLILHFGDHDPSGMDMTRDIRDRLELFMGGMEIRRLALNTDQVTQYNPPPNPAKVTDSRAAAYIAEFGTESWELDALEPAVIAALIRGAIASIQDPGPWREAEKRQAKHRKLLGEASGRWQEVVEFLEEDMGEDEE